MIDYFDVAMEITDGDEDFSRMVAEDMEDLEEQFEI